MSIKDCYYVILIKIVKNVQMLALLDPNHKCIAYVCVCVWYICYLYKQYKSINSIFNGRDHTSRKVIRVLHAILKLKQFIKQLHNYNVQKANKIKKSNPLNGLHFK